LVLTIEKQRDSRVDVGTRLRAAKTEERGFGIAQGPMNFLPPTVPRRNLIPTQPQQ